MTSENPTFSATPHPIHPRHLLGSKWSSAPGAHEHCHWEVIEHRKRAQAVVLRATLDAATTLVIPWRDLRDRERWVPGWR